MRAEMRARSSARQRTGSGRRASIHFCLRGGVDRRPFVLERLRAPRVALASGFCQRTPSSARRDGCVEETGARDAAAAAALRDARPRRPPRRRRRARARRPRRASKGASLAIGRGASWPRRSFARWGLQELDEAGVAVGVDRQVVAEQRRVDLGGDRDLRRAPATAGSGPGRPTSATSGKRRGEPAPPARAAEAERSPRRRRSTPTPCTDAVGARAGAPPRRAFSRAKRRRSPMSGADAFARSLRRATMLRAKRASIASRAARR